MLRSCGNTHDLSGGLKYIYIYTYIYISLSLSLSLESVNAGRLEKLLQEDCRQSDFNICQPSYTLVSIT